MNTDKNKPDKEVHLDIVTGQNVIDILKASPHLLARVLYEENLSFYAGLTQNRFYVDLLGDAPREIYLITPEGMKKTDEMQDKNEWSFLSVDSTPIDYGNLFVETLINDYAAIGGYASQDRDGLLQVELAQLKQKPNLDKIITYITRNKSKIKDHSLQIIKDGYELPVEHPRTKEQRLESLAKDQLHQIVVLLAHAAAPFFSQISRDLRQIIEMDRENIFNLADIKYDFEQERWYGLDQLQPFGFCKKQENEK